MQPNVHPHRPLRILTPACLEAMGRINTLGRTLRGTGTHITGVLDWQRERPLVRVDVLNVEVVSQILPVNGEIMKPNDDGSIRHRAFLGECEVEWNTDH